MSAGLIIASGKFSHFQGISQEECHQQLCNLIEAKHTDVFGYRCI